ncbi:hypothetical protein N306_12207, partial [Opisthocomus hoazin]
LNMRGIGGGHKTWYRKFDFQWLLYEEGALSQPFTEKAINVRYSPCGLADIALVARDNRECWIIAMENMQLGDIIKTSTHMGTMAVSANEGDTYPLGGLLVSKMIHNLESHPGKAALYIQVAGTCGVLLRKVNRMAIVQLPSKWHMQVLETCMATVGHVSNVDHNKRLIRKTGWNRWLGKHPHTGLWYCKGVWARHKIKPFLPMKNSVNLMKVAAQE